MDPELPSKDEIRHGCEGVQPTEASTSDSQLHANEQNESLATTIPSLGENSSDDGDELEEAPLNKVSNRLLLTITSTRRNAGSLGR